MSYPNTFAAQAGPIPLSQLDANFNFAVDIQSQAIYAAAGGSADAITATYSPAVTALVSGLTIYLRAASANATTTPTFSPNSLTAKTIVKGNNQPLVAGDIAGAGHILILQYDTTNGVWELANPATGPSQTLPGKTLVNPTVTNYVETLNAIGNSSTSKTIDLTTGTVQTVTLTGNCTFTMPAVGASKSFILILSTGAGGFTATFTSVKWPANTAPTITTTASRWDILTFVSDGTNWYGNYAQAYA